MNDGSETAIAQRPQIDQTGCREVMMDQARIRARLLSVAAAQAGLSAASARDVTFHLTDWLDDFAAFSKFVGNPDDMPAEEVDAMLIRFLVHVPNHLAAAAKLYADMPVSDIFGVGAVSTEPPR